MVATAIMTDAAAARDLRLLLQVGLRVKAVETRDLFSSIWQRKLPYLLLRALTAVEGLLPDHWLLRAFWACTKDA